MQERDHSCPDLFHILPVREPSDTDTRRILIGAQRLLEGRHDCGFELDVLPTVIDHQRRYDRTASLHGQAARMLTRLAVKGDADRQVGGDDELSGLGLGSTDPVAAGHPEHGGGD